MTPILTVALCALLAAQALAARRTLDSLDREALHSLAAGGWALTTLAVLLLTGGPLVFAYFAAWCASQAAARMASAARTLDALTDLPRT